MDNKYSISSRYNGLMHKWTHRDCDSTYMICIGSGQIGASTESRSICRLQTGTKNLAVFDNSSKRKKFLQCGLTDNINITEGQALVLSSWWPTQSKCNDFFVVLFFYHIGFFWHFCLTGLLFAYYDLMFHIFMVFVYVSVSVSCLFCIRLLTFVFCFLKREKKKESLDGFGVEKNQEDFKEEKPWSDYIFFSTKKIIKK